MQVRRSAEAGFCFGVKRALKLAMATARERDGPVYCLGPLIHNPQVMNKLAAAGIQEISRVEEARPGGKLIIRSHGVGPGILAAARKRDLKVVDATCPFVGRAQKLAHSEAASGTLVVVVGDKNHPEVQGIVDWTGGRAVVVEGPREAEKLPAMACMAVLAQTTQPLANFQAVVDVLLQKVGQLKVYNTICHTTGARQRATLELAREVDVMVVVGGASSANTRKLAALCRQAGVPTYQVETARELDPSWFKGVKVAGLTAGASTPDWIIEEVERRMKELGEMVAVEENIKDTSVAGEKDQVVSPGGATGETAGEASPAAQDTTASAAAREAVQGIPAADSTTGETPGAGESAAETASGEEGMKEAVEVRSLRPGQIVKGVVVQVGADEVLVDVGAKSEGIIPLRELSCYSVSSPADVVKVGDEIEVAVIKAEDNEGRLILSKERADAERAWVKLNEHLENGEPVEGIVREVVKGGLLVDVGLRAFLPASLVERGYVEDLSKYVGEKIRAKVIELNRSRRKVILSRKAVLEEEAVRRRRELLESLQEGQVVRGVVRRLTNFGAFVDIGGVDGLLHISEMAWYRVNHPSEVVNVGDEVDVMVLRVDRENEKVSLGLKQVLPNPWDNVEEKYPVGSIVKAKVVRLAPFGAFVRLEPGVEGLVHISHLADRHVATPDEVVQEGEEVEVKVLNVDRAEKRIRLSIREVNRERERGSRRAKEPGYQHSSDGASVTIGEVVGDLFEK
ncbi:bifunctional 4-hydroxy-3-methylbut-2-enyl diphosphate reductase/30S ribosomal protein S1 [Desulfofundulus thermocisternus]|uniref:bifunctional 4-hydroxy-3-methylbut-2-enyl diphosphate reductase/30S ribosomal protein S1 n=1 Tax=Desulfofundulus thermocisternus TaxID=42471 RepID=UPI00217CEF3A|nr:bifunctional 4-hydroxy-3-methylbut-2-enyl diphosphate reductase/30S ribosomal protein S1 [Desulfofundulus thermocisternus]MCS5696601.1 bifunctional 4-hydroxy-3-methylbut-2-enyl diphosphate reductase/30S ribosomal protein S1 [Desulfofundulus thermocisternus]